MRISSPAGPPTKRLIAEPEFAIAAGRVRAEIDAMPAAGDVLDVLLAEG